MHSDTTSEVEARIAVGYRAMTGAQRVIIACRMFETAREFVLASLPGDASEQDRRRHLVRRFYPELADKPFLVP